MHSIYIVLYLFTLFSLFPDTLGSSGNKEGNEGITSCSNGFSTGDNVNNNNEIFIQANQYEKGCIESCKKQHPTSIGITENFKQQYTSGKGIGRNKCWCELSIGTLDSTNFKLTSYKTCIFTIPDAQPLAVRNEVPDAQRLAVDNEEENAKIRSSFGLFDLNGDGQVTLAEWKQGSIFMKPDSGAEHFDIGVEMSMNMADTNGDRKMDTDEYVALYKDLIPAGGPVFDNKFADKINEAYFNHFDVDRNGQLNKGELKALVTVIQSGREPSDLHLAQLTRLIDQNYDLQISLKEYKDYMDGDFLPVYLG